MFYRLKNTTSLSVYPMDEPGAATWEAGDCLVIRDGKPRVIKRDVLDLFLEPVPESVSRDPAPAPIPTPAGEMITRKQHPMPQGITRKSSRHIKVNFPSRVPRTNWSLAGEPPLQRMEGRLLLHIADKIAARQGAPLPTREIPDGLHERDAICWTGRLASLINNKGLLDSVYADGVRYVALTKLAEAYLVKFSSDIRATTVEPLNYAPAPYTGVVSA